MDKSNFENLQVFQLAENLSDRIWHIVIEWSYFEKDTLGKQIIRAADDMPTILPCKRDRLRSFESLF